ncbi:MAG: HIT domain-containing protein, partial [Propionibacteriales bacterium]|nr:HIT domain-containing protein [Propionibacteriales bacterium]
MSSTDPYLGDDFYCDVALRNVEALDVVHHGPAVVAYHHTRPFWPVHIVVVPKAHIRSLTTVTTADEPVIRELLQVVQVVAAEVETRHGAVMILTNLGTYQDSKHLHVHVCSG